MGKHGTPPSLWPSILGVAATVLVVAIAIMIIIWNPQWKP